MFHVKKFQVQYGIASVHAHYKTSEPIDLYLSGTKDIRIAHVGQNPSRRRVISDVLMPKCIRFNLASLHIFKQILVTF